MARPRRLDGVSYTGPATYFVTTCTQGRRSVFCDIDFGHDAVAALLDHSEHLGFAVPAYCLMPDHAHVVLRATRSDSLLPRLVHKWKQATGYRWRARDGRRLWQPGYFERVLRDREPELSVARYVIENPVRAGLVATVEGYPLTGSGCYALAEIVDAVQLDNVRLMRRV